MVCIEETDDIEAQVSLQPHYVTVGSMQDLSSKVRRDPQF